MISIKNFFTFGTNNLLYLILFMTHESCICPVPPEDSSVPTLPVSLLLGTELNYNF